MVITKHFVRVLPKDGDCVKNISKRCPNLFGAKQKGGIFVRPRNYKLLFDPTFEVKMGTKEAWLLYKQLLTKFLSNVIFVIMNLS